MHRCSGRFPGLIASSQSWTRRKKCESFYTLDSRSCTHHLPKVLDDTSFCRPIDPRTLSSYTPNVTNPNVQKSGNRIDIRCVDCGLMACAIRRTKGVESVALQLSACVLAQSMEFAPWLLKLVSLLSDCSYGQDSSVCCPASLYHATTLCLRTTRDIWAYSTTASQCP